MRIIIPIVGPLLRLESTRQKLSTQVAAAPTLHQQKRENSEGRQEEEKEKKR